MRRNLIISVAAAALAATALGGLAFAKETGGAGNDAVVDLAKAKITLGQAVSAAETHAGGKGTKAELEGERNATVFNVEVVTADSKAFDVKVDAADGKVLSSRPDQVDRKGEEEDDD